MITTYFLANDSAIKATLSLAKMFASDQFQVGNPCLFVSSTSKMRKYNPSPGVHGIYENIAEICQYYISKNTKDEYILKKNRILLN